MPGHYGKMMKGGKKPAKKVAKKKMGKKLGTLGMLVASRLCCLPCRAQR